MKQIGGNILLGVPFGILVPVVAPAARGLLRVLLLTASVMLLVEFAQGALVTGRAFDIDDVILNTTGALIGYLLLGRRMSRAVHARTPGGPVTPADSTGGRAQRAVTAASVQAVQVSCRRPPSGPRPGRRGRGP